MASSCTYWDAYGAFAQPRDLLFNWAEYESPNSVLKFGYIPSPLPVHTNPPKHAPFNRQQFKGLKFKLGGSKK